MSQAEELNARLAAVSDKGFVFLVATMRLAQRTYFKTRMLQDLEESKSLERQVDRSIELLTAKQQTMEFPNA